MAKDHRPRRPSSHSPRPARQDGHRPRLRNFNSGESVRAGAGPSSGEREREPGAPRQAVGREAPAAEDWLIGPHLVAEALLAASRPLQYLLLARESASSGRMMALAALARQRGVAVRLERRAMLDR